MFSKTVTGLMLYALVRGCATNVSAPSTPDTPAAAGPAVQLVAPADGATIRENPVNIRGRLRAFENHVLLRVLDSEGALISQHPITARGELGQLNPFDEQVFLVRDPGPTVTFELIVDSANDGSIVARVSRTVRVEVERVNATVSFARATASDCTQTIDVKRTMPKSAQHARLLLNALIYGPTSGERTRGASSPFSAPPRILGISRRGDLLIVDFDASMSSVGGSCRAQALRSMIDRTLRSIPGVARVEIRAGGSKERALQP